MPATVTIQHSDGSATIIEQGPGGDYYVVNQMPDGSTEGGAQLGADHTLPDVVGMYTRDDDPGNIALGIPHEDGSTTVISQDRSGDYNITNQMPDGLYDSGRCAGFSFDVPF